MAAAAAHALLWFVVFPESSQVSVAKNDPIEIVRDLPVAQSSRALHNKNDGSKADFASEFTQRVEKQTRSPRSGLFQEGQAPSTLGPGQGEREDDSIPDPKSKPETMAKGGGTMMRDLMLSATPNQLPEELAMGDQTLLNTDSVVYASFLNRVADEIYMPWGEGMRERIQDVFNSGGKLSSQTFVTRLAVSMNESGEVVAIQVLKSSGYEEFDEAPKKAFWDRSPFPNPPNQLKTSEGVYKMVFTFSYDLKTAAFNIVPWAI